MRPGRFSKVVGIGLPKTGTTTLGAMLRRLGYRHAPYDVALIDSVARGERSAMWRTFAAFDSFEDWPWPAVFKEVHAADPDAVFVLTIRKDAETWLRSVERHKNLRRKRRPLNPNSPAARLERSLLGPADSDLEPERFMRSYEEHLASVRSHFERDPGRLVELCWERGDGWPELCAFLRRPVVEEAMPHENSHATMLRQQRGIGVKRRVKRLLRSLKSLRPPTSA